MSRREAGGMKAGVSTVMSGLSSTAQYMLCKMIVIRDSESGQVVVCRDTEQAVKISSCGSGTISADVQIPFPKLWEIGRGNLYKLSVNVIDEHGVVGDTASKNFGVGTIELVEGGILVNGKQTKILGGNIHQDWAVYDVGLPDRVIEQKLELCREMGMNALRIAHHPPTPELVDHADRMGILVLPEDRLFSTSASSINQLRSLGTRVGRAMLSRLVIEVKALDSYRPTIFGGAVALEDAAYYRMADTRLYLMCQTGHTSLTKKGYIRPPGAFISTTSSEHIPGLYQTLRDGMMDAERPAANAALVPVNHEMTGNVAEYHTKDYTHHKVSGTFVWSVLDYIGEPTRTSCTPPSKTEALILRRLSMMAPQHDDDQATSADARAVSDSYCLLLAADFLAAVFSVWTDVQGSRS
ncbi:glycoside hydrolase superfamily [Dactylonectria macrodidyma]|uniref:Glycoside hydrolase superfamily n=1 Tax=Dactylonectria macrodidyma TaxID=307937 RepID=A0A9P9DVX6_9HYPO|nr:glycoside hydrolase superfamily [Dactylonectria macrodidyma]